VSLAISVATRKGISAFCTGKNNGQWVLATGVSRPGGTCNAAMIFYRDEPFNSHSPAKNIIFVTQQSGISKNVLCDRYLMTDDNSA
jgi:hypothetical protein